MLFAKSVMTDIAAFNAEVERHYRHNFIVNFLDGTFFWCGASFIASRTILPLYVSHLTESKLVIGLLSTIATAGFMLSGIMIVFEFSSPDVRPTYIGLNNTVIGVVAAATPMIGGWLASVVGYRVLFVVAFTIGLVGFVLLRWSVREPRKAF